MLNSSNLAEYISNGIRTIVCPAIKQCLMTSWGNKSDIGDQIAETFANQFDDIVSDALGEVIAEAIDYYIKNAEIFGTVITVGSPTTQTAQINGMPTPLLNGSVPNTLGIR